MACRSTRSKKSSNTSYHDEESAVQPLDSREMSFIDNEGRAIKIPAVDKRFMEVRQFVLFKPLRLFDDLEDLDLAAATAAKEEWLQRLEYIQDDLHWLLKLPHHKFWSQVVYDESLHQSLDSYLSHAPRDFDLNCSIEEDLLSALQQVHRLVFFVFLRMSTYKESKNNLISPQAFGEMIYNNYLFDIPKILDLCELYSRTNGSILKKMISNIFTTQPCYVDDLETTVPHLFLVFDIVEEQLNLNKTHEMAPARLEQRVSVGISSVPMSTLLDVIYYLTDISSTINAFMEMYSPSCHLFYKHQIVKRLASFYDTVFPPIESELLIREKEEMQKVMERFKYRVQLAKTFLVKIFRNLIAVCCVQPIIESQCSKAGDGEELTFRHFEEYMEIFTEVVDHKHFICDYNQMFPFESDVEVLSEAGVSFDPTRLEYIFSSIHQYSDSEVCNGGQSLANKLAVESRRIYRHNAERQRDVKDLQSLAATLTNGTLSSKSCSADLSGLGASASCINDVELESLIASVHDVLPGLGHGFIEKCLQYYSFDSEKVVDAILQDLLPDCLQAVDHGLQRNFVPKVEETPSVLNERRNVFDNDEFDIFNRQDVDMQRIHQGKKNKTPETYQGLSDTSSEIADILKKISLFAVREDEEEQNEGGYYKELDLYEDEYDDTYDSNMVGLVELQTEKELSGVRPFTTPRVLQQRKRSPESQNINEDVEEEEEPEEEPPKRDEFIPNPAVQREKAEQRRETMARNRRRPHARDNSQGQGAQGRPQQNRSHKEKHKGQIANHNRRQQSDYKKSRGMGALPTR